MWVAPDTDQTWGTGRGKNGLTDDKRFRSGGAMKSALIDPITSLPLKSLGVFDGGGVRQFFVVVFIY